MQYERNIYNPTDLDLSRSTFNQSPTVSGTMNAGRLIPFKTWFVQPGDSIRMDVKSLFKMSTPVYPTMDALFADLFFFYVPFRLILSRRYGSPSVDDANYSWAAVIGAQDNLLNMPVPADGIKVPGLQISGNAGYNPGCLIDYFPVYPVTAMSGKFNALPMLAYWSIWNENFRDPNLMNPVTWSFNSDNNVVPYGNVPLYATKAEVDFADRAHAEDVTDYQLVNALATDITPTSSAIADASVWLPFPVCRFHGYFGSLLPWPQRNAEGVELPLGDKAPVVALQNVDTFHEMGNIIFGSNFGAETGTGVQNRPLFLSRSPGEEFGRLTHGSVATTGSPAGQITKSNLYADLSTATAANINALRAAFAQQRWYEKLARSGSRYDEFEYGTFGVRPHDSGDDRPMYLGGKRIPLNIEMVASTNGGTSSSSAAGSGSLGSLGAFSHTNDQGNYFYHSFDDWGVVMCVGCIRHHDTFGSGSDRFFLKRTREDLYFPSMAHLGEQQTFGYELCDESNLTRVIGYNPAWEEYRTDLDRVSGLLRPGQSLAFMTYARTFESGTTLLEFLNASSQVATVDKTLQTASYSSGFQFVYQLTFDYSIRRAMPTDSIPGYLDHF